MGATDLGRLERVSLRMVWASESEHFTPWLGQEENLRLLGETIGLELELDDQEKDVGPFRADLLCKNTLDDTWVLIENQLERTDHGHLGQLLTYAAGLEAVTIIWVAERFTDEHRAALDWLNEKTDDGVNFFGLEVELWRIGDSPIAPKFNIVSKPNDWTKRVQNAAIKGGELSSHKQTQLRFWTAFKEYMDANSKIRCQKPAPHHWLNSGIGRSGFHLDSVASYWDSTTNAKGSEIRVDLVITGPQAKEHFAALESERPAIEQELGEKVHWHNPENAQMCRIYVRESADWLDESQWPGQHEWLRKQLELFTKVFKPRIKKV
ncbi:MAG: DUF4268 domain-containing protein [Thermodesulfobacteriota bacterium]